MFGSSLNTNTIVEGQVAFEARSPGGLAVLADADVPAADAAGAVVGQSGIATYGPVELEDFLSDKDVGAAGSRRRVHRGLLRERGDE